jgi:hypothetical protein
MSLQATRLTYSTSSLLTCCHCLPQAAALGHPPPSSRRVLHRPITLNCLLPPLVKSPPARSPHVVSFAPLFLLCCRPPDRLALCLPPPWRLASSATRSSCVVCSSSSHCVFCYPLASHHLPPPHSVLSTARLPPTFSTSI